MHSQPELRGTASELLQHPWILQCCGGVAIQSPVMQHSKVSGCKRTPTLQKMESGSQGLSQYKQASHQSLAPEVTSWDGRQNQHAMPRSCHNAKLPIRDALLHSIPSWGEGGGSNQVLK